MMLSTKDHHLDSRYTKNPPKKTRVGRHVHGLVLVPAVFTANRNRGYGRDLWMVVVQLGQIDPACIGTPGDGVVPFWRDVEAVVGAILEHDCTLDPHHLGRTGRNIECPTIDRRHFIVPRSTVLEFNTPFGVLEVIPKSIAEARVDERQEEDEDTQSTDSISQPRGFLELRHCPGDRKEDDRQHDTVPEGPSCEDIPQAVRWSLHHVQIDDIEME